MVDLFKIDGLIDALAERVAAKVAEKLGDRLDRLGEETARTPRAEAVDEHEAAKVLGVSPQLLRKWRANRTGPPHIKLGKCVRYRRQDLESYLQAHRGSGGAAQAPVGERKSAAVLEVQ